MIIKHFNQGWGGVKQVELQKIVLSKYLRKYYSNNEKNVLINNTWIFTEFGSNGEYLGESTVFRDSILHWLRSNNADKIFIYNFVDPQYFDEIDNEFPVIRIGYTHSANTCKSDWLDFQALAVDKYFRKDNVESNNISVPFMCLNGKPHVHREQFVKELLDLGLDKKGYITFGGNNNIQKLCLPEKHLRLTGINADPYDAMTFGDMRYWNSHFLNVITETVWDVENFNMWTEKFFKPLLGKRPFLFYTENGATNMLAAHKFESFVDDFTDISDLDLRNPHNIPDFLVALSSQPKPTSYLQSKYDALLPKIEYNYNRFYTHVTEQWKKVKDGINL